MTNTGLHISRGSLVRIIVLTLLFLSVPALFAQQNTSKDKISGDFYFLVGPSGIPVYPRGKGNNEHWDTGINLRLSYDKLAFDLNTGVTGAATFDSPERYQFKVGVSYRLPKSVFLELILRDAYAINNFPPPDPAARREFSSVNSTWLGLRWDTGKYRNQISLFARKEIRGDEPVLFAHFTKPYSGWNLGASSRTPITENFYALLEPEIYSTDSFSVSRAVLNFGLERQVYARLILGAYYTGFRNINIPVGTVNHLGIPLRKSGDRLFLGVRIPFGVTD